MLLNGQKSCNKFLMVLSPVFTTNGDNLALVITVLGSHLSPSVPPVTWLCCSVVPVYNMLYYTPTPLFVYTAIRLKFLARLLQLPYPISVDPKVVPSGKQEEEGGGGWQTGSCHVWLPAQVEMVSFDSIPMWQSRCRLCSSYLWVLTALQIPDWLQTFCWEPLPVFMLSYFNIICLSNPSPFDSLSLTLAARPISASCFPHPFSPRKN